MHNVASRGCWTGRARLMSPPRVRSSIVAMPVTRPNRRAFVGARSMRLKLRIAPAASAT